MESSTVKEVQLPVITGGPPFPNYPTDEGKYGLSILDWFAGHVAAGLCANTNVVAQHPTPEDARAIAEGAYKVAANMVDIRGSVDVTPTPPPVSVTPLPQQTITAPSQTVQLGPS